MTHAPDPMGAAAYAAALAVFRLHERLHVAAAAGASHDQRYAAAVAIFRQIRRFNEAMVAFEAAAPNAARAGYEADARARDFIERREGAACA